jgi:prepilin-type processing-associated H-X9-DG protein
VGRWIALCLVSVGLGFAAAATLWSGGTRIGSLWGRQAPEPAVPAYSAAHASRTGLHRLALGVNYCDWENRFGSPESGKALEHLRQIGVTRVMFVPTWYQATPQSKEIHRLPGRTPDDAGLAADMRKARGLGFSVGLKLHIDPEDGSPRSAIAFENVKDFEAWFANYRRALKAYAILAAECGAEHFCVGCELSGVTTHPYTEYWRTLIRELRLLFDNRPAARHVRLTYAARHQGAANIGFWDDLDYIGINAWPYFPSYTTVNLGNVRQTWRRAIYEPEVIAPPGSTNSTPPPGSSYTLDFFDFVRLLGRQFGKPVAFTELGCQSKGGALTRPVDWKATGTADPLAQMYYFAGFFEELRADMRQFAAENPGTPYPLAAVDIWNYMVKEGGTADADYTFRNKPTERVLRRYFVPDSTVR